MYLKYVDITTTVPSTKPKMVSYRSTPQTQVIISFHFCCINDLFGNIFGPMPNITLMDYTTVFWCIFYKSNNILTFWITYIYINAINLPSLFASFSYIERSVQIEYEN